MKAPRFRYLRPQTLEAALGALAALPGRATPLAGGQSLLPALNMRVASPELLVDIGWLAELRGIRDEGGAIRIGAATRYVDILGNALVRQHVPLLAEALAHVAHAAIRNRGTLGGSLALADPAAELPACAVVLGATLHLASAGERRSLPAQEFFTGTMSTALTPEELLEAVSFPKAGGTVSAMAELSRRRGDYALAGIAISAKVENDAFSRVRCAYFGCTSSARLARSVGDVLGRSPIPPDEVIEKAVAADIDPSDTPGCSAQTRRQLAVVLTKRILATLQEKAAR